MKVSLDKCNITRVIQSSKHPDTTYFDVLTVDGSTFQCSTKVLPATELQKIALVPVKLDGILTGFVFSGKQLLSFVQLNIGKLA